MLDFLFVQIEKFQPVFRLWDPALIIAAEPLVAVPGHPVIDIVPQAGREDVHMAANAPDAREDSCQGDGRRRTGPEEASIPGDHTLDTGVLQVLFLEKARCPVALQGSKAQAVVPVAVDQEFDPTHAKGALSIIKNDQMI